MGSGSSITKIENEYIAKKYNEKKQERKQRDIKDRKAREMYEKTNIKYR